MTYIQPATIIHVKHYATLWWRWSRSIHGLPSLRARHGSSQPAITVDTQRV